MQAYNVVQSRGQSNQSLNMQIFQHYRNG